MLIQLLLALPLAIGSANLAQASNPYCRESGLVIRGQAKPPDPDLSLLLTFKERNDPGALQRLLTNDGPYGHSELGFRYLMRAFGYRGGFEDPDAAEIWFVTNVEQNEQYKGTEKLWVKWVSGSDLILRAKEASKTQDLSAFFPGKVEALQFSQCLATDIAVKRCENYHNKELLAGARVYFGGDSSHEPCVIHYNGGKLEGETPETRTASSGREEHLKNTIEKGGETKIDKMSKSIWSWNNPNHWDPNSANGLKGDDAVKTAK